MVWKWLGALVVFPLQMIYLVTKAAVGLVLPPKLRDLSRESVLITGGGRGIGRHLAREFAERGARKIILWGRTEKCLKETTEEIRQMGTECHYFICDVGNREEVYQMAKAVREKVGDITILVNNAAVVHGKSLMDSDDDALLKSQHVNTLGQFWTTKAFLPRMLELQNGHIVCLNSVLALSAIPGAIDYCTSKASAFAFMESLTLGLLDCPGVSATTVLPFHTSTEMFQGMRVRFPNLFPPLKPETVARRTVEAVQQNQALLLLPWTMNILIILKRLPRQRKPAVEEDTRCAQSQAAAGMELDPAWEGDRVWAKLQTRRGRRENLALGWQAAPAWRECDVSLRIPSATLESKCLGFVLGVGRSAESLGRRQGEGKSGV
ncbi:short-chain dehydrogenase/reductase 3 isoform X2 [Alexandromys fortis]|uniref:short-chain dehydrogenase/reductase 3 isoform X2 n=1 Tax=Alexandromys fortis TaxID=100897 RepID=UPI002152474F|nr:short-chain dehydrogenase/reductase 3 isoform X2 [Microtus fortis]